MSRPHKPDWGRQDLINTSYSKTELKQLMQGLNVDLKIKIPENELTSDMIKVMIMVYYDWKIPPQYLMPLQLCIKNLHKFCRFPCEVNHWVYQLIDMTKELTEFYTKILQKY